MISIIAAAASNGVIGRNGRIPWDIPEDRAYFRRITEGSAVIMGRRTYAEIGHPLPDRYNIIVSGTLHIQEKTICSVRNLEEAIHIASMQREDIFLCGGERIYTEGLAFAERLYLTELEDAYEGDAYFPHFSADVFHLVQRVRSEKERLCFSIYQR